jgi:hypothetical protein
MSALYEGGDEIDEAPGEHVPDAVVEEAAEAVESLLRDNAAVCYLRQLQVHFERRYYYWVTSRAVRELVRVGRLRLEVERLNPDSGPNIHFVSVPSVRYRRRIIDRKLDLLRRLSDDALNHACGRQAEILFSRALMLRGFAVVAENARAYRGQEWRLTGHDLDFILERDGVGFGCEIKNRFEYMEGDEIDIKVDMGQLLGIVPLFIVRAAPKTFIWRVAQRGGFTKVYVSRIFPMGHEELVADVRRELPGLDVDCPRDLQATIFHFSCQMA